MAHLGTQVQEGEKSRRNADLPRERHLGSAEGVNFPLLTDLKSIQIQGLSPFYSITHVGV